MNHRRARKPFVGCCTMCCLVKTRGTRKRRLTRVEVAAAIGEREQVERYTGEPCDEGWCSWCDRCDPWPGDACSTPGCPDCGGPVDGSAPVEPLTASIAERLAA